jgi:hypothetical protein
MTAQQDTALIAGQLADLTQTVEGRGFASALTTRKRAQILSTSASTSRREN